MLKFHLIYFFMLNLFLFSLSTSKTDAIENLVTRYFNVRIIRDHQLKNEDVWVSKGHIIPPQTTADREIDGKGCILAPGYIDLQINGGFGYDFSSEPEKVQDVGCQLVQYGVTAFLPTIISSEPLVYRYNLPFLQPQTSGIHGATILGIHLEGPFFCPEKRGAHARQRIQSCQTENVLEQVYGDLTGVKVVTLAPELPGALNVIQALTEKGIIVSAGHTNASYDLMQEAIQKGIKLSTHLFNAMSPLHHREPGVVGAVLSNPSMFYSLIADNIHVHPAVMNLAWKANPCGLILITDAISALGLPSGTYFLGDQEIDVAEGKAVIKGTETLAGSVLSMDVAVRHLQKATGCSIVQAIEAATLKPAQLLGIEKQKGSLAIGADADFILLNDELYVQATYIAGELAYPQ